MEPGVESHHKALLHLLSAIIEHDRICAGRDDGTLDRIFQATCGDGSMIAGYLRSIGVAQVPLEPIHPRLDRSKLRFLFSNLLIRALVAVILFGGSVFLMLTCLLCVWLLCPFFFFLFLLLLLGCEVERERANHFPLCIRELECCRSLAIVVLRNAEENCRAKWWIITRIGRTPLFGVAKAVIMSQPCLFRSEQKTRV